MSLRIGGSVIGRYALNMPQMTSAEIRVLQNNEHTYALPEIKRAIQNKQYVIVNIDTYLTSNRWRPTEQQLRNFVEYLVNTVKSYGAVKKTLRFTYDNEPMEHCQPSYYINNLRIIHEQLAGRFDLGAGNENMPLAQAHQFYELICEYYPQYFEVLDIHMQNGFYSTDQIDHSINYYADIKGRFGIKRIACTEGSQFYRMFDQYGLLLHQIDAAERLGCEDFCFIYANWIPNSKETDKYCSMAYNGQPKDTTMYDHFVSLIKLKKPNDDFTIGDKDMKLYILKQGVKGNFVQWLQEILEIEYGYENEGEFDGIYGVQTATQVKAYQADHELTPDGIVGKQTTTALIENSSVPADWMRQLEIYMAFE